MLFSLIFQVKELLWQRVKNFLEEQYFWGENTKKMLKEKNQEEAKFA